MKPMMWVALLATVGSALYVANQESADVEPVVRAGKRDAPPAAKSMGSSKPRTANSADVGQLEKLNQALIHWLAYQHARANPAVVATGDMGAWASQQPPPPYVAPPHPPPMAPPFAHTWVGRYVDTEARAVIAGASQTWVVKVGDVIDSQWRVDAVAERQLTLTYLPLNQSQTVSMK